jgi:hypothetical protein
MSDGGRVYPCRCLIVFVMSDGTVESTCTTMAAKLIYDSWLDGVVGGRTFNLCLQHFRMLRDLLRVYLRLEMALLRLAPSQKIAFSLPIVKSFLMRRWCCQLYCTARYYEVCCSLLPSKSVRIWLSRVHMVKPPPFSQGRTCHNDYTPEYPCHISSHLLSGGLPCCPLTLPRLIPLASPPSLQMHLG